MPEDELGKPTTKWFGDKTFDEVNSITRKKSVIFMEKKKKMGINFELVWCGEPVQQKQTFELIQFSLTCFLTKKKKGLGRDMMNA